jgi:O-antigen ligase
MVGVLALAVTGPDLAGRASQKYRQDLFSTDRTAVLGQRLYLYRLGWQLARDHPMGLGSAGYPAVTEGLVYPHNIELELADEYGILALGLFAALVAGAWRARRRAAIGPHRLEALVAGALILVYLVDAQVSLSVNENKLLWFALGLALALPRLRAG